MGTEEMMNEAKRAKTYRRQVLPRPQDRGLSEAWRSPRRLGRSFCRRFPPWSACPGSPTRISLDCRVCTPRSVPPPQEWRLWACCRRSHPAWCSPSLGTDSESSTRIRETPSVVCSKQRATVKENNIRRKGRNCVRWCERWGKSDIKIHGKYLDFSLSLGFRFVVLILPRDNARPNTSSCHLHDF